MRHMVVFGCGRHYQMRDNDWNNRNVVPDTASRRVPGISFLVTKNHSNRC